jgi:hypothetical protein
MEQIGGVRIDLRTNIFNLIRREDATLADLQKLYGIAPEKFRYKEPGTEKLPIEVAREEKRDDWVAFMISKGLKSTNAAIEKKVSTAKVIEKKEKELTNKQIIKNMEKFIANDDIDAIKDYNEKKYLTNLTKREIEMLINYTGQIYTIMLDKLLELKVFNIDDVLNAPVIYVIASHVKYIKILMKYGFDINKPYSVIGGKPLIIDAIHMNNLNVFNLCMENNADVNIKDNFNHDALRKCIFKKFDLNSTKQVIDKHNNLNMKYLDNNYTILQYLIVHYSATESTVIHNDVEKAKQWSKDIIMYMLEKDIDVNILASSDASTLFLAIRLRLPFEIIKAIVDKGANVNQLTTTNLSLVYLAAFFYNVEAVKLLLEKGANKKIKYSGKTALEFMYYDKLTNNKLTPSLIEDIDKIIELLEDKEDKEDDKSLWKGTTKSDIDKFDTFFESPNDWSVCPICLSYVSRQDGCMYMSHVCKDDNKYYHKELYNKYVYDYYGKIKVEWCTICGRITQNHKHYKLVNYKAKLPDFEEEDPKILAQIALGQNRVFFDDKNCKSFGGGGLEEKVARIRRLREYALELNDDIDTKTHANAIKELIEEVWNSPFARSKKYAKILEKKEWNIPLSNFPNSKKNETAKNQENNSKNYANIPFNDKNKLPTKHKAGECSCVIGGEDDVETYSFDHKDREGGIDHSNECICAEDLTEAIKTINKAFKNVERPFGYCWFYKCKAKLYPNEIKNTVPDDVYEEYRKKFNKIMAQKGGRKHTTRKMNKKGGDGQKHILQKIDLDKVTCYQPPLKLKRKV